MSEIKQNKNIYEKNYDKFIKLVGYNPLTIKYNISIRLKSKGFMDLIIERLHNNTFSMTHYFELNGDLVADPDMTFRIVESTNDIKMLEALSYQDQYIYQEVYVDEKFYPKLKKQLNSFLSTWLTNLKNQGFCKIK